MLSDDVRFPSNIKDFYNVIDKHKNYIKSIDRIYKSLLKNDNKEYVLNRCVELQEFILDNVNYLNGCKDSFKVIPKKKLKDIVKKFQALYLGYLQENKNIQAIIDIWEIE